jgi:hypothetical protein
MTDRKTPLWPWIVALLIGMPVIYVLALGPVARMTHYVDPNGWSFKFCTVYLAPAGQACDRSEIVNLTVGRYARLWTADIVP